ncbi:helix-turn-helix domain-containing protein [Streptosporangium roseum]|uniref:helix-turn-helix domain-containing protein n=1 Tax=Streptosporangium roseum TaxID=2001 RepID=UPI0026C4675F
MGGAAVLKLLFARAPKDAIGERKIRKPAGARHAPADWIRRAQIVALSWERLRVPQIARELGCAEKTVRYRPARFNAGAESVPQAVPGPPDPITPAPDANTANGRSPGRRHRRSN